MPRRKQNPVLLEFLAEHYFDSVAQAQQAVKLGIVSLNNKTVKRAGITFDEESDQLKVVGGGKIFVSRGGYKLQKAIKEFDISVEEKICLDIGASTGGFTDCLLQHDASEVYAIDTGYGQLAWELRKDQRVHPIERMNVRYLLPENLYASPDITKASLAVIDVSFISVIKILPSIQRLLLGPGDSEFIILIKPQFEAGKNKVASGGVIRNPDIHLEILLDFLYGCQRAGLEIKRVTHSPLLGASGNLEFLAHLDWLRYHRPEITTLNQNRLEKLISSAYKEFALDEK